MLQFASGTLVARLLLMKRLLEDVKACSHGKPGSRSLTDLVAAAILVGARGYMHERPVPWQSFVTQRGRGTSFLPGRALPSSTSGKPMLKWTCDWLQILCGLSNLLVLFLRLFPNVAATSPATRPFRKSCKFGLNGRLPVEEWKAMLHEACLELEGFEPALVYRCTRRFHTFPALRGKDRNGEMCCVEMDWGPDGFYVWPSDPDAFSDLKKTEHDVPFPERAGKDLITLLKSMESKAYAYNVAAFNCHHFTDKVLRLFVSAGDRDAVHDVLGDRTRLQGDFRAWLLRGKKTIWTSCNCSVQLLLALCR